MLTFGPDGMTGHADHRAVSRWTTTAFAAAAGPGARLLYATKTAEWDDAFAPLVEPFEVFVPGTPTRTPVSELAVALRLSGDLLERKLAALRAQRSQTAGIIDALGPEKYAAWVADEFFRHPTPDDGTRA